MNTLLSKLLLGGLGTVILTCTGLYIGWINAALAEQIKTNEKVTLHNVDVDFDLEIVNAKLDLLLQYAKLRYDGPGFKSHRDHVENNQ